MAFEAGAMYIHSASPVADSYTTGNLILLLRTPGWGFRSGNYGQRWSASSCWYLC